MLHQNQQTSRQLHVPILHASSLAVFNLMHFFIHIVCETLIAWCHYAETVHWHGGRGSQASWAEERWVGKTQHISDRVSRRSHSHQWGRWVYEFDQNQIAPSIRAIQSISKHAQMIVHLYTCHGVIDARYCEDVAQVRLCLNQPAWFLLKFYQNKDARIKLDIAWRTIKFGLAILPHGFKVLMCNDVWAWHSEKLGMLTNVMTSGIQRSFWLDIRVL